ncbi:hypothetical protein [Streptomyces corynorhini]|uniref:Uncharacterized protein n=1 Tax=Streptomyces corynorhini TaxID=2282652 RepID=A0A370B3D4_9ACTN|nr:hypothetical protein [Streptomyces corynorhini]RDG35182.1 hypothetical protein DVH02_26660 [Streptomyces corynorhini]
MTLTPRAAAALQAARRHRRYEAAFATCATALAGLALWHAAHQTWLLSAAFAIGGLYFAAISSRRGADYRRAHIHAAGGTPAPCCATWTASHRAVHDPYCHHTNPEERT